MPRGAAVVSAGVPGAGQLFPFPKCVGARAQSGAAKRTNAVFSAKVQSSGGLRRRAGSPAAALIVTRSELIAPYTLCISGPRSQYLHCSFPLNGGGCKMKGGLPDKTVFYSVIGACSRRRYPQRTRIFVLAY